MVPWHMGALHPYEQALTFLLAFGPIVVLGVVIAVRRRADRLEEEREGGRDTRSAADEPVGGGGAQRER